MEDQLLLYIERHCATNLLKKFLNKDFEKFELEFVEGIYFFSFYLKANWCFQEIYVSPRKTLSFTLKEPLRIVENLKYGKL